MPDSNHINTFKDQGFLIIENAFTPAQISALRQAALKIVDEFDADKHRTVFKTNDRDTGRDEYFFQSAQAVHCFLEEGALDESGELNRPKEVAINKIGHAMHDLIPDFEAFCRLPFIAKTLREIGHTVPQLVQTMYIFKQPGIGGEVRWHQDASYLIADGRGVTGIWIAIEDATKENGCLWMQPGQHRSPLREIYEVNWDTRVGTLKKLDDSPWLSGEPVAIEVKAGSAVFFNDRMPHYSCQNTSDKSRHAFTIHVTETNDEWSEKNWIQRPDLEPFLL